MQLAINYSLPAANLVTEKQIPLDYFKTPDWPDMIADARLLRPVAVHFTLHAGHPNLRNTDWTSIERLLSETSTPFVNLHLDPIIEHYPGMHVDTVDLLDQELVLEQIIFDVETVAGWFGKEKVIVENVPYRALEGKVLRPAVEPATIQTLLAETGCGLLLDLQHARIAAHYLGIDERQYIASLPTQRIKEMHFAGLHNQNGRLEDHLDATEEDWRLLEWALENIRCGEWSAPWLLAFEYGGVGEIFDWRSDPNVMQVQVPRLYEMVHAAR
ncbi:MAG: DUF692 family protein [Anaerolineales bacterium]|nr:DUF692 family protein [Anaerolineales bacterium]